jgi:hypothetical protein
MRYRLETCRDHRQTRRSRGVLRASAATVHAQSLPGYKPDLSERPRCAPVEARPASAVHATISMRTVMRKPPSLISCLTVMLRDRSRIRSGIVFCAIGRGRDRSDVVLGTARRGSDHHAQSRRVADPKPETDPVSSSCRRPRHQIPTHFATAPLANITENDRYCFRRWSARRACRHCHLPVHARRVLVSSMPPARLCRLRKEARGPAFTKPEFATDSPLGGDGFELSVRAPAASARAAAVISESIAPHLSLPAFDTRR